MAFLAAGRRNWFRRIAASFQRHIRYRITKSGYLFSVALILVGSAALASANNLLFLILAAMLATLMISGVVSRLSLAGLEVDLVLPEHIFAAQSVPVQIRLRNLKWFPSFAIQLGSRPGASAQILRHDLVFPVLPGRDTVTTETRAEFPRRGLHRENLFVILTRFPFGFVERRVWVCIPSEIVIYPEVKPDEADESLLADLRGELEREERGLGADFYRVRPYEFTESARYVDWKISAHTRELQVREFAREEHSTVYLFLDLAIPAGPAFEAAVESCASLIWLLSSQSVRIRFRTQAVELLFPEQADIYDFLRSLALAESAPDEVIPEPGEFDPQLLWTERAASWEAAQWQPERVIAPTHPSSYVKLS